MEGLTGAGELRAHGVATGVIVPQHWVGRPQRYRAAQLWVARLQHPAQAPTVRSITHSTMSTWSSRWRHCVTAPGRASPAEIPLGPLSCGMPRLQHAACTPHAQQLALPQYI